MVQAIEPPVFSVTEAYLLDAPELSPALLFDRPTTETAGHVAAYVHSVHQGERYRIVSRLRIDGGGNRSDGTHRDGLHPGIPSGDVAQEDAISTSIVGEDHAER
ncbi:hypothetical protein ACFQS2_06930 [Brachybacterium sp. GCM10030267]|uniref:hypothetical protein n=1 Tax=unclassified Brachybacterium TaxID=2623841 RepID=UPI00360D50FB